MSEQTNFGSVATIGVFDGLHLGHLRILDEVTRRARKRGLWAAVVTFEPHPDEVLGTQKNRDFVLTSQEEKARLLAERGIDMEIVLEFTREMAGLDTSSFVRAHLAGPLNVKELVVGHDFRMGKQREGGAQVLAKLGTEFGFSVVDVDALLMDGLPISSTRVREAVRAGDVSAAARFLGRLYSVEGEAVRGDGVGSKLGFPTANILPPVKKLVPLDGVYAGYAETEGLAYKAAINIGTRPTVGRGSRRLEAHLLGFEGDLVGRRLRLSFVRRLRPERKFSNLSELRLCIKEDIEIIAQLLKDEDVNAML